MRKWHRWISLVVAIFMVFIAGTGLLLQLDWYFVGRTPPTSLSAEPPPPPGGGPGAERPPPPAGGNGWIEGYKDLHNPLQNLHAFYFLGPVGRWLSMGLAAGLLVLSITGIVMYVQLYGARRRLRRRGLFWK